MQGLDALVDAAGRKEAENGEDFDLFSELDENEDNESVAEVELEVSSTKPAQRWLEVDEGEYHGSPSKRQPRHVRARHNTRPLHLDANHSLSRRTSRTSMHSRFRRWVVGLHANS